MAIGRTMEESLHKAIRSLDIGRYGFEEVPFTTGDLANPTDERLFQVYTALKNGMSINKVYELTKIDKFFLYKILEIIKFEKSLKGGK